MRISVVVPPLEDFYHTPHRSAALGACTIAGIFRRQGHSVFIHNFPLRGGSASISLPPALNYLKPYILPGEKGPLTWFTSFKHFGPAYDSCARMIAADRPDYVLFSCFAFCYADNDIALAEALKRILPSVPLAAGGGGPSSLADYYRRSGFFDEVFAGTAESGFSFGSLCVPPGDSCIPVFAPAISRPRVSTYSVMLSRGCPRKCRFCSNHLVFGRQFITPERGLVLEAVRALKNTEKTGIVHLNIEDDNLLLDKEFMFWFLGEFRRFFPGSSFSFENGIDYNLFDDHTVAELVRQGVCQFNLSLGSLEDDNLAREQRCGSPDRLAGVLGQIRAFSVPAVTYFICGLKGDTIESMGKTLLFLAAQPTRIGISPFYPVPGLPDFTDPNVFLGKPSVLCSGSACRPWNGSLSTSEIITAFRLTRYLNALKEPVKNTADMDLLDTIASTGALHTRLRVKKLAGIVPVPHMSAQLAGQVIGDLPGKLPALPSPMI